MSSTTTTTGRQRRKKLAAGIGSLALAATAAAAPTPTLAVDQVQHFLDCFGWMFSDGAQHAANCSPGHAAVLPSHAYGFQAPVTGPTTTTPTGCSGGATYCYS